MSRQPPILPPLPRFIPTRIILYPSNRTRIPTTPRGGGREEVSRRNVYIRMAGYASFPIIYLDRDCLYSGMDAKLGGREKRLVRCGIMTLVVVRTLPRISGKKTAACRVGRQGAAISRRSTRFFRANGRGINGWIKRVEVIFPFFARMMLSVIISRLTEITCSPLPALAIRSQSIVST